MLLKPRAAPSPVISAWLGQARLSPVLPSKTSLPKMRIETHGGLSPKVCIAEMGLGPRECVGMFSLGSKNLIHKIIRSNPQGIQRVLGVQP